MFFSPNYDLPIYVKKFIKYLKRVNYSEQTIIGYSKDLKIFNEFIYREYQGKIMLEQVTRNDILDYMVFLQDKRAYKPNSVYRHLSTLKSFYRFLVDELNIKENVAAKIRHQKVYTPLPPILDIQEMERLLLTAREYSLYFFTLFSFLYYTGSRITPVISLEKKNVNLKDNKIYFPRIKGGEDLYLPIHNKLKPIMETFLNNHPAPAYPFVFHSPRNPGEYIDHTTVRLHLKRVKNLAGIEKRVTPHIIRHCTATHLTLAKVDQKFISNILGQKDPRSTARYQQLNVDNLRDSLNLLP
ncbi:tyrosine-type recombinase/integrase [Peribacillus sp. NPDC097198]|uniref:tyrosine-type recombinase/integrase n=1 Tax=Peribacillus sp. NPDC097198 TaxID=3364397 RepID=UPI003814995C